MAGQRRGQNQHVRQASKDLFSLLPKFSGFVDEDFSAFVDKYDEVSLAMGIPNNTKALYLPLHLENYAHSTFKNLPEHIQNDYNLAIIQLRDTFAHPEQLVHASSLLMNRVQNTKESIAEYAHALCMLGNKCYSDMPVDTLNKIL